MRSITSRVLITGGAGFVGANIIRAAVQRGDHVCALIRPSSDPWRLRDVLSRCEIAAADIRDEASVRSAMNRFRPKIAIHAAMSAGHPRTAGERIQFLSTSVMGTANLVEAALDAGVQRFIHIGSSLVYGSTNRPYREEDPLDPPSPRGVAKAAAALWCRQFAVWTGLPVLELRLFSVYGPWEGPQRLIPKLLRAAETGAEVPLCPSPRRDLVYVEDVADACLRACSVEPFPQGVIHIGSGKQWSNTEVAEAVQRVAGCRLRLIQNGHPANPGDRDWSVASISRARDLLRWEPRHSLEQGLSATLAWMRARQVVRA